METGSAMTERYQRYQRYRQEAESLAAGTAGAAVEQPKVTKVAIPVTFQPRCPECGALFYLNILQGLIEHPVRSHLGDLGPCRHAGKRFELPTVLAKEVTP